MKEVELHESCARSHAVARVDERWRELLSCLSYICAEFEKRQDFDASLIKDMKNSNQKSKFV